MPDVVTLGDINVDIIAYFPSYPAKGQDALASSTEFHCGGSAANTAIGLARMGLEVSLISRVGVDPWASKALDALCEAGVLPAGIQRDLTAMTGLMYVVVTPDGERTILGDRGANSYTEPNEIDVDEIRDARLFHLSGYALLTDPQRSAALLALEVACRHDLTVTLDPGMSVPQAALDEMRALLPVVDIFLPSLAESQRLVGLTIPEECAEALLETGVRLVALKLGRDGCLIASKEGLIRVPGFAVETRDTTGAGDHFAAGYIAGFLGGLDSYSTAVLANAMGAVAAACTGAGTSIPSTEEVVDLLRIAGRRSIRGEHQGSIQRAIDFMMLGTTETGEEAEAW
ncbi:MAG TPA: sugar kinase [Anaerolineae bacterium]|nr:sugar kinase [Anaerolineae bacterium]